MSGGATLGTDGRHRPDPPPRAPPLERGARPGRRRRRGRGRPDVRRGRRGGRDHATRLPPHPRRPRLEDPVGRRSASASPRSSAAAPSRSVSGRPRSARSTSSTSITPRTWRCAGRSPGSAATSTSSSTATGSPGSSTRSGRTRTSSTATRRSTRSPARRSSPRSIRDRMMEKLRPALPGLRLGAQPGLRHAGAPRRDPGPRPHPVPSALVPRAPADAGGRPARARPAGRSRRHRPRPTTCWSASSSRSWPTTPRSTPSTSRRSRWPPRKSAMA